jgi:Flp pilus assembly secretin CpaC
MNRSFHNGFVGCKSESPKVQSLLLFFITFIVQLLILPAFTGSVEVHAQMPVTTEIHVGKSQIISLKQEIAKISVANHEVADVEVISPSQIVIFGKSVGVTNLILFDQAGNSTFFDVAVRQAIEGKQVLLQVIVAEVERNSLKDLGVNFVTLHHDPTSPVDFGGGSYSGKASPPAVGSTAIEGGSVTSGLPALTLAESVAAAIFRFTPNNDAAAVIKALSEKGLMRTLAEPNLVVRSGEKGKLLVGGRFPIPIIESGGGAGGIAAVTIQYEEFGVRIDMSPDVYEDGRISLVIDPAEVSSLDYANAVTISGFQIPAIKTREVHTTVDLQENETLVLAGLINHEDSHGISKFPLLGDIPILGALFRSKSFQNKETDLMIFITPRIVQPLKPGAEFGYPGKDGISKEELKQFRWIPLLPPAVNRPG